LIFWAFLPHKVIHKDRLDIDLMPEGPANWHPVGGISWEERARRMKAAGITSPEESAVFVEEHIEAMQNQP
jgi:hypothetical protein